MKVLLATEKPFAAKAVNGIQDILEKAGHELVRLEKYTDKSQLLDAVADVDAMIVRSDKVTAEVVEAAKQLKLVVRAGAGYDNVDLHACTEHGIVVMNTPGQNANAVAELAIGMMIYMSRNSFVPGTGSELSGKRLGIIGFGKIGSAVANIANAFGMKVIAYDKYPTKDSGIDYVSLDELFSASDIISLHCPLTDETKHLIDEKAIAKMKKGVILINTSRGALIDTEALLAGIKSRKVGAACLDVYEEESDIFFNDFSGHIMDDDTLARLISMPNVLVTSHQAFLTEEALNNIAETTVNNIIEFSEKGFSENELCYRCGKTESCKNSRHKCF